MTNGLGHDASRLIESALLEERVPTQIELARVRRALLRSVAIVGTTGAAAPLAAQTIAAKSAWVGFIANGSFAAAVAVGATLGGLTFGGAWVVQRINRAPIAQPSRVTSQIVPGKGASSSEVHIGGQLQVPAFPELSGAESANVLSTPEHRAPARELARRAIEPVRAPPSVDLRVSRLSQNTRAEANNSESSADSAPNPDFANVSDPAPSPAPPEAPNESAKPRSLSDELAHLEQAQRAMNRGDATTALALLDQLKTVSASSSLLDERLALEVLAACQAGQQSRAVRVGHLLLQRSPGSPLAARIETSCAFSRNR